MFNAWSLNIQRKRRRFMKCYRRSRPWGKVYTRPNIRPTSAAVLVQWLRTWPPDKRARVQFSPMYSHCIVWGHIQGRPRSSNTQSRWDSNPHFCVLFQESTTPCPLGHWILKPLRLDMDPREKDSLINGRCLDGHRVDFQKKIQEVAPSPNLQRDAMIPIERDWAQYSMFLNAHYTIPRYVSRTMQDDLQIWFR